MLHHMKHYQGKVMKTVTLRNIPHTLDRMIGARGRAKKMSLNKAVIDLLEEHLGSSIPSKESEYHDLDDLAGVWSQQEADAFDKALTRQRSIDKDLWK
jgi:hypothetical protein